ncbi:MAG: YbjN domain-containing protein [Myxococcota bacterium]
MVDEATLRAHLERLGWEAVPHGEGTLKSVHLTSEGEVPVYLRLDANWLVASVVPFLATGGNNSFELARWLLRMNRDMRMSKFAYDEDGDVVLTLELPTESLDYEELAGALVALLDDAMEHRATLRAAATS